MSETQLQATFDLDIFVGYTVVRKEISQAQLELQEVRFVFLGQATSFAV